MTNGRLVSYRTIMGSVQRDFPFVTHSISDEEALEWLGSFMGLTNCPVVLSTKVEFIEVCDGRAQLPCDLHLIVQVARLDNATIEQAKCGEGSLRPMRWKSDNFHRRYHDSPQDFRRNSNITYTVNDNYVFPNFSSGIVAISYKAIPSDEEGYPMIPADEQWVQAAIHEIAWRTARKLWYSSKMEDKKFQKIEQDRDWYLAQAVVYSRMPSIDQRESIKNNRLSSLVNIDHHNNFFQNFQLPEHRMFKGQYLSNIPL